MSEMLAEKRTDELKWIKDGEMVMVVNNVVKYVRCTVLALRVLILVLFSAISSP